MDIRFNHKLDKQMRDFFKTWKTEYGNSGANTNGRPFAYSMPPEATEVLTDGECVRIWSLVPAEFAQYLRDKNVEFDVVG
ncbi:hypothetical protein HK14_03195 [Acetobacter cibinongensis]|uniref:Uncharacterized protein n=2 Tax=Acetobacter cibinongensis TaxID=146475 RepID=A0A1Z5YW39_9PROT|nr:hypothetical protein HK14_03195 [Acetobacter cibinongensis]